MTPDWPTTRAQIVDAFDGELPGAHLEAAVVDLYEANPTSVLNAIESIATSLRTGKINSGWAVLKSAAAKKALATTNPTISREKLIRNADQWLRNAGVMFDRWHEVRDELFGEDRGRLRTIHTPKLEERYHQAYLEVRPDGERLETHELARAEGWKASHTRMRDALKTKPEPQAAA